MSLWQRVIEAGGRVGFVPPVVRPEVAARAAALVDDIRTGRVIAVAANQSHRLIGAALLRPGRGSGEHTGRVELILVDPTHAGNGIGGQLMAELMLLARSRGLERLDLDAADEPGLGVFLGRFGFEPWGRRPGWIRTGTTENLDEILWGVRRMTSSESTNAGVRRRIIDLSHIITDGLVTYPGIPGPVIGSHLTFDESASHYAAGTEFSIGIITMAANTGTYLDTPAHRYRDGDDLAAFDLRRMVDLDGVVVRARVRPGAGGRAIDESDLLRALDGVDLAGGGLAGRAVLIETGHSDYWGDARLFHRPSVPDR